ncbi:MAG: MBG domain-containing protein, partial [Verrucomicrobia bacterium]|nr:MBG domain-containing protein [Verrucomicrobiota bacterium]
MAALDASRVYGQTNPVFTAIYLGFVNGETNTELGGTLVLSSIADTNSPVGQYAIIPGGLTAANYSLTFSNGTLTVLPHALTVTAQPKTKIYGAADPVFTVIYSGFVNGETNSALGGTLAFSRVAGESVAGSPYAVTPSGLTSTNYAITYLNGTITINKAALTITANNQTKVYGAADPTLAFTANGFQFTDTPASVLTGALTRVAGESVAAGPYAITQGTLVANGNYTLSFTGGALAITPATLTVVAQAKNKVYGAADPALTFTVSGLQLTDTQASALTGALTRAVGESVAGSPYAITQGTLTANGNYTMSFTSSSLTITPATLTIAAQAQTKLYGAADPALTFTATGFQSSDTAASVLTGALTRAAGESVAGSPYAITQGTLAANGNYTLSFTGSALAITPSALTIAAQAKTKAYGVADPLLTFTASGFHFTDTAASVLTGALTRAVGESVAGSPYAITQGTVTANGNYTISYTASALTITPAALTIAAQPKAKVYGAADPTLTFTASGFQFADTQASVLTGALTRAVGETVAGSPYAITQGSLAASGNYTISFTAATLAITPAALTIAAQAKTKVYGAADPALTFTASGLQFTDTAASVLTGALTRAAGETVAGSPYAITQGTVAANGNYATSFTANALTITPASLVVTANNSSRLYGAANPALTGTVTGLQNGDSITASFATVATVTSPVGAYSITATLSDPGSRLGNYNLTTNNGTLTVTAAALTVQADDKTRSFGTANPVFTGLLSGLKNADNITATFSSVATPASPVGTYPIVPALVDPNNRANNYTVTLVNGTLTVTNATTQRTVLIVGANSSPGALVDVPVVLTALGDEHSVAFSLAFDPTLLSYQSSTLGSALASGSTLTVNTNAAPTGALGVQATLPANGTFPVGDGQLAIFTFRVSPAVVGFTNEPVTFADNPTVREIQSVNATALPATFVGGSVSVALFPLTVTADNQSRTYGAANPVLTGTLIGVQPGDNITATFATVANSGSPVGSYAIIATLLDPDHKLSKYSITNN